MSSDVPPSTADEVNEVDLVLRHVTHRFPDELARALLPDAASLTGCSWLDTQLTARDRRLDKGLYVVADGEPMVEHVEWQLRWTSDLLFRMYEYHSLYTLALRESAPKATRAPRVHSTVVLLGGREAPWPPIKRFRTVPRGEPFSGLCVHVEAVYQRTVAELASRRSPLWMIFAPLAVDASRDNLPEVVRGLRRRAPRARFDELALAMTVLADADRRERGLRQTITAQLPEELVMRSWVYTQGLEKGREEGRAVGLRDAVSCALAARGLRLAATHRSKLDAETSVETLQTWLARAVTAERARDVFA